MALVPLFAGRVLLEKMGRRLHDEVVLYYPDGVQETYRLSRFARYTSVRRPERDIRLHGNIEALTLEGAEVNAVNNALLKGSEPENLVLSPTAIGMDC